MKTRFQQLLEQLDAPLATYSELDRYYSGTQPLAFLSPEAKATLGDRLGRMASNLPRLAVTSLSERLRLTGLTRDGKADPVLWRDWLRNDLDQQAGVCHREALTLGTAYAIVWGDDDGRPKVSIESARQVTVLTDPGSRVVIAALKKWDTATTTEAVLYEADQITWHRAKTTGAVSGFEVVKTIPNPLGVVPVVPFRNGDRLLDDGVSEIEDLKPLVDGLNKVLADMMVTSEYVGRPRRWATGIELEEEDVLDEAGEPTGETEAVNPIPEGNRAMVSENETAKFGQLAAADLAGYEASVRVLLGQIMAVSALPAHYVGVLTDTPASADALRASEASLTARAEARQSTFGRAWEQVARLMLAVRDGVDVETVDVRAQWADAATRSIAQEADAVVKLVTAKILPASYALARLGYSSDEIDAVRAARRAEALDGTGANLDQLLGTTA